MPEVSTRFSALLVDSVEQRGLDLAACLEGTGVTRGALTAPNSRVDWVDFVHVLERVETIVGGPEKMKDIFVPHAGERTGHTFVKMVRLFLSPADTYRLIARWGTRRDVTCVHGSFEELGDRRARFTMTIDDDFTPSEPVLHFGMGILKNLPGLVGLPTAEIAATIAPREAIYELVLPKTGSVIARARRALEVVAGAEATLEALEAQSDEIRTKNQALEQELAARREAEDWLQLALDAAKVGVWSWELGTDRVQWSPGTAEKLFGIADDAAPRSYVAFLEHVHPDDLETVARSASGAMNSGARIDAEYRTIKGDGTTAWISVKGEVIRDSNGAPVRLTGTVTDVTERKALESRLVAADRMIAAGTLAAGVAHELNNPLAYVMANIEMLGRNTGDVASLKAHLETMADGTRRMRDIIRDLQTFSRPEEDRRRAVDLRPVIESAMRMVSNELRHRARIETDFGDAPLVLANESRLGQVFINLLLNAAHAIPDEPGFEGVIRVSTRVGDSGEAIATVSDNGVGIAPAMLARIFDPFFTTKPVGRGTGLGLAVSHGIVTALGGRIEVESTPGAGSTFRIVLPRMVDAPRDAETPAPAPGVVARGTRVLVVDDEHLLRRTMKKILESHGFEVSTAASGREGLELAKTSRFDVVLCDLMMPDVSGMDVHAELARTHPTMADRFIFVTGGAFTERAAAYVEGAGLPKVEKPFELEALVALVERVASEAAD